MRHRLSSAVFFVLIRNLSTQRCGSVILEASWASKTTASLELSSVRTPGPSSSPHNHAILRHNKDLGNSSCSFWNVDKVATFNARSIAGFTPFPPQGQPNLMESDWRDWANHPEAITAIWPRALASGMSPASCLALLGTCLRTRNTVLREAPRTKLTVQLGPEQPAPASLLCMLKQSGRTQPTTLALLNRSTGRPSSSTASAAQPPKDPHAASANAQHILSHSALLGCITRLDLQGVLVDPPLLKAMQGLPALTHMHLTNIHLPAQADVYHSASLPQGARTLHIELHPEGDVTGLRLAGLLTEFLMLDTITDLTATRGGRPCARDVVCALEAVTGRGRQARMLRKLSLPHGYMEVGDAGIIQCAAPLLAELQVLEVNFKRENENFGACQVSWRTLRVRDLNLSDCANLPLGGGTEPLDIHVSGNLCGHGAESLPAGIMRLTSQQTRPVRLVGSGRDGGGFRWDGISQTTNWFAGLSALLQLSKAPVCKLDIFVRILDAEELLQALQPLTALTQLSLNVIHWDDAGGPTLDGLLARLPLHVERIRLVSLYGQQTDHNLFKRMAVTASTVHERQAHPLHLGVVDARAPGLRLVGVGPGNEVWEAVDKCRAHGHVGVVMEEGGGL